MRTLVPFTETYDSVQESIAEALGGIRHDIRRNDAWSAKAAAIWLVRFVRSNTANVNA